MPEVIPISAYADLVSDRNLDLRDADAIAVALDRATATDVRVVYLPGPIAEENILDPEDGSDCVFVVELLADRETGDAYYARQGRRACWLPKAATRVYVEATDADIFVPESAHETEGSA